MATLTDAEISDLVTSTLQDLGRMRFTQIAQRVQHYEVMGKMLKKDKLQFDDGGYGIKRTIMVDHSNAARHVGLYETDDVNVGDVLQTIAIPWRHLTTNFAYERREILENSGVSRIVKLLDVRRTDAMISMAELMETAFWSKPADSTDETKPFGISYWIVYNATTGFNGGNATGFTTGPGGLDSATYTR